MKRGSSLRLTEWPMPPTSKLVLGSVAMVLLPRRGHRLGRVLDGFDDVDVPRAPAQVSGNRLADLELGRRGIRLEQRIARHHHPRGAVAALEAVLLREAFLDGIELAAL